MKIGVKITLLVMIAAAGIAVLSILSISSINTLDGMFNTLSERFMLNQHFATLIRADLNNMRNESAMIFLDHDQAEDRISKNSDAIDHALLTLDSLKKNIVAPEMVERVTNFEKVFQKQLEVRGKFKDLVLAGKWEEGRLFRIHELEDALNNSLAAIREVVDYATSQSEEYASIVSTHEAADTRTTTMITIMVIAVILVVFSIVIIMGITKPLKRAVDAANSVSDGDLNVDLATTAKDETGILMNSLETMVKAIHHVITDTNDLSAAAISGRLEVRSDANKHKGAYKDLVIGINKTLDAVIGPLNMTAEYVDRISKGDIPPRITDPYNGDFNEIKNNLNGCMDTIDLLVKEINESIKEAINGNLKYRADVNKFKGDYSKIMESVNNLVDTFVEPLEVASAFLSGIANGDDQIQKITKEYKGEFNTMKNSVNLVHDVLFTVLGEMLKASEQAERGELDAIQIDSKKVKGAWGVIMDALNKIGIAAGSIINDAGAALSIMATGDLTPRITKDYPGKYGEMKNNINNLGDSLTDLISQLAESIHTTAAASAQISATAETIATATQEQSSQTDEVAGAVEEMSRTVTENAHSAGKTAEVAKQSGEVANSGGKVVQQTVAKMREISAVVRSSAENIAKLGDSSKKIGEIISVIDDIADQTNLLSLNAAIEAARAGEQGRGFAVVADSVGKLAISTASATKEIADMIKGIQMDTEAAVRAMEKGTSEVQSGIELADSAGNSIQNILSGINELLNMINQIAAASEEQSATSEQISKNVSSMSKVTAESARNIEDVASTANELAKMTDTLTSLVSQFKINEGSHHHSLYSDSISNKKNDRYLEK